ncbi:MAG TPA: type II toxin-antitoxin system RelE/ParE family toxin [Candidatus Acidoferrales bacterium]|nr:type II toxin-antitoxin system RelE/ParE family toxin [Candidatus Acidoferrales bacterium]
MSSFRLSLEAARDITEIFDYIAQDSEKAAERVRVGLLEAMRDLARMPGMGHRREDLTSRAVLFWPMGAYQVIYKPGTQPLQIVAVLHGKRNIRPILRER